MAGALERANLDDDYDLPTGQPLRGTGRDP
jgi:hypothetical protein